MATRWIAQLRAHCSGLTDEVDERGLSEDQVNMFADFDAAAILKHQRITVTQRYCVFKIHQNIVPTSSLHDLAA